MFKLSVILTTVFVFGCATGVRSVYTSNGKEVFEAKCNGIQNTIADCHAQAAEQCHGKYEDLGSDGKSTFAQVSGRYVPVNKRSLMFACK